MCVSLVRWLDPPIVIALLLPHIQPLVSDRVAIVRLALARLVRDQLLERDAYKRLPATIEMIEALRQDRDRDVLIAAHSDPSYEPPRYTCRPDPPPRESFGVDGLEATAASVVGLRLDHNPH